MHYSKIIAVFGCLFIMASFTDAQPCQCQAQRPTVQASAAQVASVHVVAGVMAHHHNRIADRKQRQADRHNSASARRSTVIVVQSPQTSSPPAAKQPYPK